MYRFEFKGNHEEWINNTKPFFGPEIAERVQGALTANFDNLDYSYMIRTELEAALTTLLGVILFQTVQHFLIFDCLCL